jgi:hypothetical protein
LGSDLDIGFIGSADDLRVAEAARAEHCRHPVPQRR